MTERQQKFVEFIEQFEMDMGYSPTMREIAAGMGLKSVSSVKKMLDRLESLGVIRKPTGKARGIELTHGFSVPVVGRVKAGVPVMAEENIEGYIPVKKLVQKGCFFLKVEGDSMKDKGINEGDFAMIKPARTIEKGQIGVFRINGEVTLKTFMKKMEKYVLQPENEDYRDIPVEEHDDFEVIGVLTMLVRVVEGMHVIESA